MPPTQRNARGGRKSREGCRNCKLRKVKCDELKPRCKRCKAYGVVCSYDPHGSELQLSVEGVSRIEPMQETRMEKPNVPRVITPYRRQMSSGFELDGPDMELLSKFEGRTLVTVNGAPCINFLTKDIFKLACTYTYLTHAALLVTAMHDRFLFGLQGSSLSTKELSHCQQSLTLFTRRLSGSIPSEERDALWVTSGVLGTISFFNIEAQTPEEAWPLKPFSKLDLNWLRLSEGKRQVWHLTNPVRQDGVLRGMALEHQRITFNSCRPGGLGTLPSDLLFLCDLDEKSNKDNNAYFLAASTLSRVWNADDIQTIFLYFFSFITTSTSQYTDLLEEKDHRALLLLAYWYAFVCQTQHWWVLPRAMLECQAICIFLERHDAQNTSIQALLQYPRTLCGMTSTPSPSP